MKLQFMGANRQVTGSRYCLEVGNKNIVIDYGLVQERAHLARNWDPCPIEPSSISALMLTHIHIDHCGLVPKLVSEGFKGPIYATPPSVDLAPIMFRDSAKIQEEDARHKRRRHKKEGRKGPHPDIPLYDSEAAEKAIPLLKARDYDTPFPVTDDVTAIYRNAGHILGSAMIELHVKEGGEERVIVFSGDIGQWDQPMLNDPATFEKADYVIMESTYGDREHLDNGNVEDLLRDIINRTVKRGGNVVIPVFAVERAQQLMYHISRLVHSDSIPDIPVYLDSPMAVDVTEQYRKNIKFMDEAAQELLTSNTPPLRFPGLHFARKPQESRAINDQKNPCIIMSTAGMCNAGRIKHHLRQNIDRKESTILFVGFQAEGTLGRRILEGRDPVRIHRINYPVRAEIAQIQGVSAHADQSDLLRWLGAIQTPPRQVFITHGEEQAALTLEKKIEETLGWDATVPHYGDVIELT